MTEALAVKDDVFVARAPESTLFHLFWTKRRALLLTFICYLITAQVSAYLYTVGGTAPSVLLTPFGIALAAVVLEGYVVLPAVVLAALANGLLIGSPLPLIISAMFGNTLQAALCGYFLQRVHFDRMFTRMRDMFALIAVALTGTVLVPTGHLIAHAINGTLATLPTANPWVQWWLGGVLSVLVLTTLLIRWIRRPFLNPRTKVQYVEIFLSLVILAVTTYFYFATPYRSVFGISLLLILFAPLFWLAFRGSPRFMSLAIFMMTVISLVGTLYGNYESSASLASRLLQVQIFDICIALFFFILVTLEEQRQEAQRSFAMHARKLESALERIRQNDAAKNEFIAMLGHELRNPLAALLSAVELLKAQPADAPPEREVLISMDNRIRTMGRLLDDILDITRIRERKFTMRKEPISLSETMRRAVSAVEPLMMRRKHTFSLKLLERDDVIEADAARLEQILVNLLHNAAKYTPSGGSIELSAERMNAHVVIAVRDTGIGIAPEMVARIFEPFVQVNPKMQRESGIGIGLSLTKSLVEMHGGRIEVKSGGEGLGTEFLVHLPLPEAGTLAIKSAERKNHSVPLEILVVDDNVEAAQALGKLLRLRGHRVTLAHDGAEALASADPRFDVVILDIGLPDMDGYEVARSLRASEIPSALIALTGYGQESDKEKSRQAGFQAHLTKPVGLAEIEEVLSRIFPA